MNEKHHVDRVQSKSGKMMSMYNVGRIELSLDQSPDILHRVTLGWWCVIYCSLFDHL